LVSHPTVFLKEVCMNTTITPLARDPLAESIASAACMAGHPGDMNASCSGEDARRGRSKKGYGITKVNKNKCGKPSE
jgi:hypothetical protein